MPRQVTVAVVVMALVFVPVAGVTAASTPESASVEDVTITRGDTAEIEVSHSAPANLTIGSQDKGFEVVVPLGGDDTDTVKIDTYATTGPAATFISVDGATLKTAELDHSLAPGSYMLNVTVDGTSEALGTLQVLPRNGSEVSVGVAPRGLEPESSDTNVLSQTTERATVARGDYAVFVVNDSSLSSAFNPDDLSGGAAANGIDARLVQLDPAPNSPAEEYVPTSSSAATVISKYGTDEAGDRFLVAWDTSQLETSSRSNGTYEFRVTLQAEHNALVEEDERIVTERVTIEPPSVELEAKPSFTLAPWDEATMQVSGETNIAPKSTVDLRAVQEEPRPFLWSHDLTVSKNGTFSATFDFSSAAPPTSFPLWVQGYRSVESETVTLSAANASVAFDAQTVADGTVTVRSVSLSHGGFVRISAGNATIGSSAYLPAGEHSDVRVRVNQSLEEADLLNATVVADRNRNTTLDGADAAYNVSGTVVFDSAVVRPESSSSNGTTTPGTTTTPDSTTTASKTTTLAVIEEDPLTPVPENETGGSSSGSLPLSPLVVVVAFALAGLLGRRS